MSFGKRFNSTSPESDRVAVDRLELNDISYAKLLENTTSSAEHALWNIDPVLCANELSGRYTENEFRQALQFHIARKFRSQPKM